MTGKTKKNFGEILMAHYESYLQNLDRQVRQREQEYKRQKDLADQVNSRLLPPGVVEQLKNLGKNEKFDAKTYDEVSLYFSDIVGFTTIGKQSTPQQIMTMMDKLFIMFDDIIGSFRCTKVETIGDAYFVVSGCPDEYEDHAAEIARFALAIRNCYVVDFQIPHLPQEILRMRIGLHTGSVVASVVGNLMPRWCLFGEDLATVANCEELFYFLMAYETFVNKLPTVVILTIKHTYEKLSA